VSCGRRSPRFASGKEAADGVFQVRMNNLRRDGGWDLTKPAECRNYEADSGTRWSRPIGLLTNSRLVQRHNTCRCDEVSGLVALTGRRLQRVPLNLLRSCGTRRRFVRSHPPSRLRLFIRTGRLRPPLPLPLAKPGRASSSSSPIDIGAHTIRESLRDRRALLISVLVSRGRRMILAVGGVRPRARLPCSGLRERS